MITTLKGVRPSAFIQGWASQNDPSCPDDVRAALQAADQSTRSLTQQELTLRLTDVRILANKESVLWWDKAATVYVVSLVLDGSGAHGQDLSSGAPVFSDADSVASRYITVHRTPLLHNILDGDTLPLLGGGIVMYGPKAPQSNLVELHGVIAEGDEGYRKLGAILEDAARQTHLNEVVDALRGITDIAAPQLRLFEAVFWATFQLMVTGLKANNDDVICDFHGSFLRHLHWNVGEHRIDRRETQATLIAEMSDVLPNR